MKNWRIENAPCGRFSGAIVIPCLAESENILTTLHSLAANPSEILDRYLIVAVLNNSDTADSETISDNIRSRELLEYFKGIKPGLNLSYIDAFSGEMAMPEKYSGVGLARKIGLDLSLEYLDKDSHPVLVSLDADTLVMPDYLETIENVLKKQTATGAVIPFSHRKCEDPHHQEIIDRYEIFLRAYICGLKYAGSPYAFHSVGSAMACHVSAYIKCGGMNCRKAGEDFYFLQKLKKVSDVIRIKGTTVYPSPRKSRRVPFGTGKSVISAFDKGVENITFYDPGCYEILKKWLEVFTLNQGATADELMNQASLVSGSLCSFLENERFTAVWERVRSQKKSERELSKSFHEWFDGLMTMKLIHHLSADGLPRSSSLDYVVNLFSRFNFDLCGYSTSELLDSIRYIESIDYDFTMRCRTL